MSNEPTIQILPRKGEGPILSDQETWELCLHAAQNGFDDFEKLFFSHETLRRILSGIVLEEDQTKRLELIQEACELLGVFP